MVTLLLLTWLQAAPAQPAPQPARPRATTPTSAPSTTVAITVTDSGGAVLENVTVTLLGGAVDRDGTTGGDGRVRLLSVPPGTYRARFAREGFHTFEKEIAWRAGQPGPTLTVTLNAAPPPPSAPKTMVLPDYIEKNYITNKEGHKENLVGCSGVGQSLVWQVRQAWPDREHPSADAMLYIIGGEGTLKLDGRDVTVGAGSFAVVPRGTDYGLTPRGRNPLIVLATLAGAPCAGN
jgi:mannose-6-phosphate isomerase-like protein (cupin superfamily)